MTSPSTRTAVPAWYAHRRDPAWSCAGPSPEAVRFHRSLPDYAPSRLVDVPALARELGVGRVLVKDEASRFGLPAFKALGASWALHRALAEPGEPGEPGEPVPVYAATDGNHGRAVARFARRLGHPSRIFLPDGVPDTAARAIAGEGADVVVHGGSYDDAVAAAAGAASADGALLVQDTAWDGYVDIPSWIVEGYATLFTEVDEHLAAGSTGSTDSHVSHDPRVGAAAPDLVVVPTGVGSLLQAALAHYRRTDAPSRTAVLAAEASAAACLAVGLEAGRPVTVPTVPTVMAGLNCGTPSALAWPYVTGGLDAVVAVTDDEDLRAARDLAELGVPAGPCGAASLAAARVALTGPGSAGRREHLGVGPDSVVVLVSTESIEANPLPATDRSLA